MKVADYKELIAINHLKSLGFNEPTVDQKIEELLKETGITPIVTDWGDSVDSGAPEYYWIFRAIRGIINAKIPKKHKLFYYPPYQDPRIKIWIDEDIYYKCESVLHVSLSPAKECLAPFDSLWLYENHELVKEFMEGPEYAEIYDLVKEINNKFSILT